MPLYNWIRCNDGKINYVAINPKKKQNLKECQKAWVNLYNEYLKEFGLDKRYEKYLEAKKKLAILQGKYLITRDKFKLTEIEVQKTKIESLEKHFGNGQKIEMILISLSMFLGFKIDQKNTTTKEYFILLEEYGKANKKV